MMQRTRLLKTIGLGLMLALFLTGSLYQATSAAPRLQSGGIVSGEGTVFPVEYVDLAMQTGGSVQELLVSEGDQVSAGDPLVILEADTVILARDQAEARLISANAALTAAQNQVALAEAGVVSAQSTVTRAEANLALTVAGPRPEEIAAAEARIAAANASINQAAANRDNALDVTSEADILAAQANLASATNELRQLEEGYQDILDACFETPDGGEICPLYGPVEENTREQLEVARLNQLAAQQTLDFLLAGATPGQVAAASGSVALAVAGRDLAQAELDLLLAGATDTQIRLAELGVEQAELSVQIAQTAVTQAEAGVVQAEAGIAQAEAALAGAQATLDRFTLVAPMDGTIADLNISTGELVGPGVPIISLADFSSWVVKTDNLTELNIPFVEVGADVIVSLDAIDGVQVSGTVSNIALIAGSFQGDVVYEVVIDLEGVSDLPLRWGMTGFVEIEG